VLLFVATISSLTGKRKILPDVSKVSIGDQSSLPKTTLALTVLALQQVASPLFPTKNFPCSSDFETLGNGFPCFCFSSDSWHGTGKLGIRLSLARGKWHFLQAENRDSTSVCSGILATVPRRW
jgi:hypothetical protein